MRWPLHVTLTVLNVGTIDAHDIRKLKKAFQRLRRTRLWSSCVKGGVVAIELTNTGKGWHPHLHCLCDCEWLSLNVRKPARADSRERKKKKCQAASQELHDAWCKIIGQMMASIAVRRCSGQEAVREVLKYAVKPGDLIDSQDPIGPAIRAISGGRLTTPFGSLFALKDALKDDPRPPFKCPGCGEVGTMLPEAMAERVLMGPCHDAKGRHPLRLR